jgi:hypothetical protein
VFDVRGRAVLGRFVTGLATVGGAAELEGSAAGSALFVRALLGSFAVALVSTGSGPS